MLIVVLTEIGAAGMECSLHQQAKAYLFQLSLQQTVDVWRQLERCHVMVVVFVAF